MTDHLSILDSYLSSDESPDDCLMLSDLDGFLHGVVCCPDPIVEWMDIALGEANEVPGNITKIVDKRLKEIRERLEAQNGPIEPIFWKAPEGHAIAMDWCEGFMQAVKLRPEKWDAFSQTDKGSRMMLPILVHMFDDDGNSLFDLAQEDVDETLDAAANAIPTIVPSIYREIRVFTRQ